MALKVVSAEERRKRRERVLRESHAMLREAIELDPSNDRARENLEILRETAGQHGVHLPALIPGR